MKIRIITIITACLLIAAALSLLPSGALRRPLAPLTNRFETILARPLRLKAPGGVYDTTDHYLKPLEIPRPSETISKVFSEIPPGDAIIFITKADDDGSELVYRTVSYLGWPRQIGEVRCDAPRSTAEAPFLPHTGEPVKWLLFYLIAPPPELNQAAKKIGPRLTLTPASESKEWKSYCSQ
ncbi:MAG TPA: hypothetical protein VJ810_35550 [Blastocatellia bacterium]|nr:hypothetical protein [Blastocatellia bacterium]